MHFLKIRVCITCVVISSFLVAVSLFERSGHGESSFRESKFESSTLSDMSTDVVQSIDVVIPWSGESPGDVSGANRDDGILLYTIRSMIANMGWIRHIHVFADQMREPDWMAQLGSRVRLVNRCENFIGRHTNCPSQNSFAVYLNLHTITSLSDRFILCDDDVLITQQLSIDYFFIAEKIVIPVGNIAPIYSGSTYKINNVSYVDEVVMENSTRSKPVQLPSKLPSQMEHRMHTPLPLLKSQIQLMHQEFREWFDFVSSHRTRFCFTKSDRESLIEEPGNLNGGCYREDSIGAIFWYLATRNKILPPLDGMNIKECSVAYADVTEERLPLILRDITKPVVNINDPAVWPSNKLELLLSDKNASLEYQRRKSTLLTALEEVFPAQGA